jgi:tetratricopeptide (TPR) repeat protein
MPQDAEAHGNLGAALHDAGRWADALVSLRNALAIQPGNTQAMLDAANSLRALGRAPEAVPLYQRALQQNPRHVEAWNNLGNAFLESSRHAEAINCYRSALQWKPDDARLHCNLANAQRLLGAFDEALASGRRAVSLDPTVSFAHKILGLTLAALGEREAAIASFGQAVTLRSDDTEALNYLGSTLRDVGRRREAAELLARAIALDPGLALSHYNLGLVLFEFRRVDEALESFSRAVALRPAYGAAHVSLGTALRLRRRYSDAEKSAQAALDIDPNDVDALCLLGELRADRGEFSDAEELFQRAIAIDPNFPSAFVSIATHRKMTSADADWRNGVKALLGKRLALADEISLHYALGKYFDDVRLYHDAFAHYRQANELTKRYGGSYDRAKLARRVDEIIRRFTAPFLRQRQQQGSASELPVFVVGMPRSGTSLTEQILASHSAVFGAGEVTFWNAAFRADSESAGGHDGGADGIPGMARDYLQRLTAISGAALRVVDKMPANFMYAGLIHCAFPRAKIIHVKRHPIDTCLSIYFQNFFNMGAYVNDLGSLADYYGQYVRITNHWRTVLPETALLEVPYEALIADQEGWTRRMLDFINLPWDPKCLDFHRTNRVVITASKWQVRQKIHTASVGRWKHYEKYVGPLLPLLEL